MRLSNIFNHSVEAINMGFNTKHILLTILGFLGVLCLTIVVLAGLGVFAPLVTDEGVPDSGPNFSDATVQGTDSEIHRVFEFESNSSPSPDSLHLAGEIHYTPGVGATVTYWSGAENRSNPYSEVFFDAESNTLYERTNNPHSVGENICENQGYEYTVSQNRSTYTMEGIDTALLTNQPYKQVSENTYRIPETGVKMSGTYLDITSSSGTLTVNDDGVVQSADIKLEIVMYQVYGDAVMNTITGGEHGTITINVTSIPDEPVTEPQWVSNIPANCTS